MSENDNPEVVEEAKEDGFGDFEVVDAEVVAEEPVVEAAPAAEPVVEAAPVTEEVAEEPVVAAAPVAAPASDVLNDVGAAATAGAASAIDSIKRVATGGVGTGAASTQLDDAATFIGPKADYYIPAFQKMDATGSAISWNWAAFVFGLFWMLYRKMWLYALVIWGALFVIGLIPGIGAALDGFLGIASWILFGLFGNWLYKRKVEEELAAAAHLEPAARKAQLASRGGITWIPVIVVGALTLIGFLSICGLTACAVFSDAMNQL